MRFQSFQYLKMLPRTVKFVETEMGMLPTWGWPRGGGKKELLFSVFSLRRQKKVWGWVVVKVAQQRAYIYYQRTIHLKIIKMGNFMLCIFPHNFLKGEKERAGRRR